MSKLQLPGVTLMAGSCRDHHQTLMALLHSQSLCEFNNTVYFSNSEPDLKLYPIENLTYIKVPRFRHYYDICTWFMTSIFKHTEHFSHHVMAVHWDGYPIRPQAWNPKFLNYDYVGSPWPNGEVGNNGFCIYSRNFLKSIKELNLPADPNFCHPSDQILFRRNKHRFAELGMKIAPYELAFEFSTETYYYNNQPCGYSYGGAFGFHGIHSFSSMKGWDIKLPRHHLERIETPTPEGLLKPPFIDPDYYSMNMLVDPTLIYSDKEIPNKKKS